MANSRIARIQLVTDIRIGGPTETISALDALLGDDRPASGDPYSTHLALHQGWVLEEEPGGVRALKSGDAGEHELFFPWTSVAVVRYAPAVKGKK